MLSIVEHREKKCHENDHVFAQNEVLFGKKMIMTLHKMKFCLAKMEQRLVVSRFFRFFAAEMKQTETILTITGSDGTGGSGVQADIRTISAMGAQAVSAVTCITVQNSLGIQEFFELPVDVVKGQIEAVVNDVQPQIIKVGMLRSVDMVDAVVDMLLKYRARYVICDPTVRSSKGEELMSAEVIAAVKEKLEPLCSYVVKHEEKSAHGRGNLFTSAICVGLSKGEELAEAVEHARDYVRSMPLSEGDGAGRSGELYAAFMENVERFFRRYSDVAFYSEQLNVSTRYLAQVTRRIAHRSPKSIIEERIVEEVTRELMLTNKSLKVIAAELGFSSQAHLTRFFRKQKNMSPSEYRKENKVTIQSL